MSALHGSVDQRFIGHRNLQTDIKVSEGLLKQDRDLKCFTPSFLDIPPQASEPTTAIQESVFVGRGDKLVACGSDDGRVYIYCSETGLLLRTLLADEDVANCIQVTLSHGSAC